MSEWKEYKLGDICTELSDGLHKAPIFKEGGDYIFVNAKNIANGFIVDNDPTKKSTYEEFLKYSSPLNDTTILYSIDGTIGNIALYRGEKCILGKGACYMNPNPQMLDRMYLYYELQSLRFKAYIDQMSTGSTIQHISLKTMRNYIFSCPPLSEQKRIASILSSLDDKIDLLNRENATLEAVAETLFRQWFIEETKEDWEEGKLEDEFEFIMGQSPNGDSFNEDGIGVPMYQGNADFGFRFPTRRVFTTQPTRFAKPYDTLISVRAPVGAQNMATEKCCIGRGVAAFRYKSNPSYHSYTYYKLKSLLEEIKQFNDNGTVFGSISKSDFENLDIVIPDDDTIKMFQNQVKVIDDKIINNNNEIQTLIQTRDGLLPKLMSNEIKF
jgi:type I restriction enzyme S subunit